ncbi:hypothetical protein LN050_03780 [Comamonadaceae bacterium M7527]|nr:hypothetical protein LN050_03780 [Comamonadaceae bacterium M7527]
MRRLLWVVVVVGAFVAAAFAWSQMKYQHMHGQHHMGGEGHAGGAAMHDEVNMPGLHGKDTTAGEVADMAAMFQRHQSLRRTVEHLPNGIRTVTETDDDSLRTPLVNHVVQMLARLQTKRDPEVRIQSPTLTALFEYADAIETTIAMTPTGIAVTQTSADDAVVKLLQTHAAEVSDMAARGMRAVHERLGNDHSHQHGQ